MFETGGDGRTQDTASGVYGGVESISGNTIRIKTVSWADI
jgi:hypothetical protein